MAEATFRFYGPLNDFLAASERGREVRRSFDGHPAVRDPVQALGVPHPEVHLLLINGEPAGLDDRLQDGDRVAVLPRFHHIDLDGVRTVGPPAPRCPRFVLDTHLGRLARYLRMLGFDTLYEADSDDDALARISSEQGRILLTRDRGLLKRRMVQYGRCLRTTDPLAQAIEVANEFDLAPRVRAFTRCIRCNGALEAVDAADVRSLLPPRVRLRTDGFTRCRDCRRLYWPGTHFVRMRELVARIVQAAGG